MKGNDRVSNAGDVAWLVIVNPNAGRRKIEKDWPEISALLVKAGFRFTAVFTEHRNHAVGLTETHIDQGFRNIIVVGGDGTMNEVVNGVFRQHSCPTTDVTLGMVMVGTGNDWGRMYNIKPKYEQAVHILKKQRTFIQDAGHVTFYDGDVMKDRYFVNMAGMGYDALVAELTNELKEKGKGGPFSYLLNLFKGLFRYHHVYMSIEIDGKESFSGRIFSMSIGICKYNGGGMMQLPKAVPDDGLFDLTVIRAKKMDVIKHIKKLYDGSFIKLPIVDTYRGSGVKIKALYGQRIFLETDGESLGHSPFGFGIVPKSIKLITGKNWKSG